MYTQCGSRYTVIGIYHYLCTSTSDREVVEFLTYGWPISHNERCPVTVTTRNHSSAVNNLQHVTKYILKELRHNTLVGPLASLPFTDRMAVSPMSTRDKKEPGKKRVIVDCSWPENWSVNDGIQLGCYLEQVITLRYPTVNDLCRKVKKLGLGCYSYKDMAQAFRQIPMDPRDWSLLGLYWEGAYFLDKAAVMGCRTVP